MLHALASLPDSAELTAFRAGATPANSDAHGAGTAMKQVLAILDQLDHGVVLQFLDRTTYFNRMASVELEEPGGPLRLEGGALSTSDLGNTDQLQRALCEASTRGRRRVIELHGKARSLTLSVVPADGRASLGEGPVPVLVMLPRLGLCSRLAEQWFASAHGLTRAESNVLSQLWSGCDATGIAALHGVAVSTVRTQIASIKTKTSTRSMRDLLLLAARLPPLVPVAGRV